MDLTAALEEFPRHTEMLRALVAGLSTEDARWKPSPTGWSVLEVVSHLLDEERLDFRMRIDTLLHRPGEPFPPIDPEGWAVARAYNTREFEPTLAEFLEERRRSLDWLRALPADADWDRAYADPRFRGLRSGDLLASWLTHDLLHLRQIIRIHLARAEERARPYTVAYAGA